MPSQLTLTIPCETYLAQWFIHDSGGQDPVKLRKNSPEMHLLRVLLASKSSRIADQKRQPASAMSAEQERQPGLPAGPAGLRIIIPHFRGMPPDTYNYISPRAERIFTDLLRRRFDLRIFTDLVPVCEHVHRRDELILEWMELNGIEPEERHWFAVDKRLSRILDRMKATERVRRYRARKRSQKKQ